MEKKLNEIEQIRIKQKNIFLISFVIVAVIMLVLLFGISESSFFAIKMIIIVFFIFIIIILHGRISSKYNTLLKEKILVECFKSKFEVIHYDFKNGLSEEEVHNFGLIWLGNRYSSDDYFELKYKDIEIKRSDVLVQNVTSSGKSTHTKTIFRGQIMIFSFNKYFDEYIQVREKVFGGVKGNYKVKKNEYQNIEKINFESVDFNNQFEVFSSDGQMSFYVLTPHFMQDLIHLKEKTDGQLLIAFYKGKLCLAINSEVNKFEGSLFTPCDEQVLKGFNDEIDEIITFIDSLIKTKKEENKEVF